MYMSCICWTRAKVCLGFFSFIPQCLIQPSEQQKIWHNPDSVLLLAPPWLYLTTPLLTVTTCLCVKPLHVSIKGLLSLYIYILIIKQHEGGDSCQRRGLSEQGRAKAGMNNYSSVCQLSWWRDVKSGDSVNNIYSVYICFFMPICKWASQTESDL